MEGYHYMARREEPPKIGESAFYGRCESL